MTQFKGFGSQFDVENSNPAMLQKIKDLMDEAKEWTLPNLSNVFAKTILNRVDMLNHALNLGPIYVNGVRLMPKDAFNLVFSNLQTTINCLRLIALSQIDQTPYKGLVAC